MEKDWKEIYLLGFIALLLATLCCLCVFLPSCVVSCVSKTDDGLVGLAFKNTISGPKAIFGGATYPVIGQDNFYKEHILMTSSKFDFISIIGYLLILSGGILGIFSYKKSVLRNICKALFLVGAIVVFCEPIFFYVFSGLNDVSYFTYDQTAVYQSAGPIVSFILGFAALIVYSVSIKMIFIRKLEVEEDE